MLAHATMKSLSGSMGIEIATPILRGRERTKTALNLQADI